MDFFNERDDLDDIPEELNGESEIQIVYNGAHILITGSSGFIGILLLEKLLRYIHWNIYNNIYTIIILLLLNIVFLKVW